MIEKARPHGWIDDERKAIKAHIEWVILKAMLERRLQVCPLTYEHF